MGVAETSVPTAIADGADIKPWLDEYGRTIIRELSSSGVDPKANTEFTLLASAARTAVASSTAQSNPYHKGMIIFVDVTLDAAAAAVTPTILINPVIGTAKTIWTAAAPIAAVGQYAYVFYPAAADAASYTEAVENVIPADWTFTMTVADTDAMTYSVTGCYIV